MVKTIFSSRGGYYPGEQLAEVLIAIQMAAFVLLLAFSPVFDEPAEDAGAVLAVAAAEVQP